MWQSVSLNPEVSENHTNQRACRAPPVWAVPVRRSHIKAGLAGMNAARLVHVCAKKKKNFFLAESCGWLALYFWACAPNVHGSTLLLGKPKQTSHRPPALGRSVLYPVYRRAGSQKVCLHAACALTHRQKWPGTFPRDMAFVWVWRKWNGGRVRGGGHSWGNGLALWYPDLSLRHVGTRRCACSTAEVPWGQSERLFVSSQFQFLPPQPKEPEQVWGQGSVIIRYLV